MRWYQACHVLKSTLQVLVGVKMSKPVPVLLLARKEWCKLALVCILGNLEANGEGYHLIKAVPCVIVYSSMPCHEHWKDHETMWLVISLVTLLVVRTMVSDHSHFMCSYFHLDHSNQYVKWRKSKICKLGDASLQSWVNACWLIHVWCAGFSTPNLLSMTWHACTIVFQVHLSNPKCMAWQRDCKYQL